jgi:hypothetical protein
MADFARVVRQLQEQKSRIERELSRVNTAVAALQAMSGRSARQAGLNRTARVMSAAARRRIAAAQKARWAKWRKAYKAG